MARRLAISDRIVVYYFPSKDALVTAVLVEVGDRLQEGLPLRRRAEAEAALALIDGLLLIRHLAGPAAADRAAARLGVA